MCAEFKRSSPGFKLNIEWAVQAHYIQLHILYFIFFPTLPMSASHVIIALFVGFFDNVTPGKARVCCAGKFQYFSFHTILKRSSFQV
jgi:hypothetical protein